MQLRGSPGVSIDRRYELQEFLGRGGFGEVWRATNRVGQGVAVKLALEPQPSKDDLLRLRREASISAQLGKLPCFVGARDVGQCEVTTLHFIVYDLVEGAKPLIVRKGSLDERLALLAQAAAAVAEAHRRGVIHRDIKPANFLVGLDGLVRLHDFGLAKLSSETDLARDAETVMLKTHFSVSFGTGGYAALEQMESAVDADARSDVFALGATLYEALMGELPYRGSWEQIKKQMRSVDAGKSQPPGVERSPMLRSLPTGVAAALADLCSRALQVDQTQRTVTADELARGVRAAIRVGGGQAPVAGPPVQAPSVHIAPPKVAPGPAAEPWGRIRSSPGKLRWLLDGTRAEAVKKAIRRVLPGTALAGIPKTDGKVHYIDRLISHLERGGSVDGLRADREIWDLWQEEGKFEQLEEMEREGFFDEKEQRAAGASDAEGVGDPFDHLGVLLCELGRDELLLIAERLDDGDVKGNWATTRVAAELARWGDGLGGGLMARHLAQLAKALGLPSSGRNADVFARVACGVAALADGFDDAMGDALVRCLSREQLLAVAGRLGDEDVKPNWSKAQIASELLCYRDGQFLLELTAVDLKALLREQDLSITGAKPALVARVALNLVAVLLAEA